ncbi:MAG TPA: hypothetical protein VM186_09285 [Planctomycetota bacterium]|nr:hypothetical protein [Planctomycetota bacterium]
MDHGVVHDHRTDDDQEEDERRNDDYEAFVSVRLELVSRRCHDRFLLLDDARGSGVWGV